MKKLLITISVLSMFGTFSACEGGPYDSSGNGAVIRETNKDDMDQLEGKDGDKVTIPNSGTDQHDNDADRGRNADPTDSTHRTQSGHDHH